MLTRISKRIDSCRIGYFQIIAAGLDKAALVLALGFNLTIKGRLLITPDIDIAASRAAIDINLAGNLYIVLGYHIHGAALRLGGGSIDLTGVGQSDAVTLPLEGNFAASDFSRRGRDFTAVHDRTDDAIELSRRKDDHTAFSLDSTSVFHSESLTAGSVQSIDGLFIDSEGDKVVTVHIEFPGRVARRKGNLTQLANDEAFVANRRSNKGRKTSVVHGNRTLIDDLCIGKTGLVEDHVALHEVIIGDVPCRGEEAVGIDLRPLVDDNTSRVDDKDITVGLQETLNLAGSATTDNAMKTGRVLRGHIMQEFFILTDVEGMPVDDRAIRRLVDSGSCTGLGDGGFAAYHLTALRSGIKNGSRTQKAKTEKQGSDSFHVFHNVLSCIISEEARSRG